MSNYLQRVVASGTGAAFNIRAAATPPVSLPVAAHADLSGDANALAEPVSAQHNLPLPQRRTQVNPQSPRTGDQALASMPSPPPAKVAPRGPSAARASQSSDPGHRSDTAARANAAVSGSSANIGMRARRVSPSPISAESTRQPDRTLQPGLKPQNERKPASAGRPSAHLESDAPSGIETSAPASVTLRHSVPAEPVPHAEQGLPRSLNLHPANAQGSPLAPQTAQLRSRPAAPPWNLPPASAPEIRPAHPAPLRALRPTTDQNRNRAEITIGRVDVQVNNHQPVPLPPPARSRIPGSFANVLEARYLNRFSLKP